MWLLLAFCGPLMGLPLALFRLSWALLGSLKTLFNSLCLKVTVLAQRFLPTNVWFVRVPFGDSGGIAGMWVV